MDANQLALRNELEFCFAEAALNIGPRFIFDMLLEHYSSKAEITLLNFYHDHGTHDWDWPCWGTGPGEFEPPRTQGPWRETGRKASSLYARLLERMAGLIGCPLEGVQSRIEGEFGATHHLLAHLDLDGKARLMQGFNLKPEEGST